MGEPTPVDQRVAVIQSKLRGRCPGTFMAWTPVMIHLGLRMGAAWYGLADARVLYSKGHEASAKAVERAVRKGIQAMIVELGGGS